MADSDAKAQLIALIAEKLGITNDAVTPEKSMGEIGASNEHCVDLERSVVDVFDLYNGPGLQIDASTKVSYVVNFVESELATQG
ncbi:hypothetical protein [Streptomyces sp. NPDC051546]|uniref:hypothetical protein n=1 Tax=Streptomyces sp. NPDC051546 TaxID=3365655 RepID=UPI0037B1C9DD